MYNVFKHFGRCTSLIDFRWTLPLEEQATSDIKTIMSNSHKLEVMYADTEDQLFERLSELKFKLL